MSPHVHGKETDYCMVDVTRCDNDGIYKYKWATGYEDFLLRHLIDDNLETIRTEPELSLQRAQITRDNHPNREGYINNGIKTNKENKN